MRIGIIALLHESNTFVSQPTTLRQFHEDLYLEGEAIRQQLASSHHEIGGFFAGLERCSRGGDVVAVPLLATRATPAGVITAQAMDYLVARILSIVAETTHLDGILVAPHGAAVSQSAADADGYWLSKLRELVGSDLPIIGTLDAHANLSPSMVKACNALVAYRTNPHLDQRARGIEAATLMVRTLRGEIRPTMAASFPPLVINIERQCTSESHLQRHYQFADQQLSHPGVLSNSILLGFPYADVAEMGAATIVVTDDDAALAQQLADDLAQQLWQHRGDFVGQLVSIDAALQTCQADAESRYCLLDMGDNVGGGSAADGTTLVAALLDRRMGPSFVCLYDPQ
jgi:microcystin degradation protein MlrC